MSNRCQVQTQNIAESESCGNNTSGVTTIYFAPKSDITTINATRPANMSTYRDRVVIGSTTMEGMAITMPTGKGFGKMFCADDLGELVYTPQGQKGSRSFKAELEIFHPSFKKDILGFLATHNNQEMVIVAVLNNGEVHLLGTKQRGVSLADNTRATSGKEYTSANGAECHFEWNTPAPQIFWDEFDPEDENHGIPLIAEE